MKNNNIVIYFLLVMAILVGLFGDQIPKKLGAVDYRTNPTYMIASSTAVSVTTASNFILATSTPTKRLAATIQPINCSSGNLFVRMLNGNPAIANTGIFVQGSSTLALGDFPNSPSVVQGSVTAITSAGTCVVLVTEWRSQF
jgi:hypothetical protein